MSVAASTRLYFRVLCAFVLAAAAGVSGISGARAAADESVTNGTWQSQHHQFQYLGTNTTYACGGLADKLRVLLRTVDARNVHVNPVCLGNPGLPDRFAQADMRFESLMPLDQSAATGATATVPGVWRHVQWAPNQPNGPQRLGAGDCALIQQLLSNLMPLLATRNLQTKFDCARNHDYGSFSVSFEVFAPAEAPK